MLRVLSENDYRPSAIAKSLVHNTSDYISVIIEDIRHSHYTSIAFYFAQSAKELGFDCIISNCNAGEIDSLLPSIAMQRPRAVVIVGSVFSNKLTEESINSRISDTPVVMINGSLNCPNVTSIFPDDRGGIALAVNYFFSKGYERICFVKDNQTQSSLKKEEGYRNAMAANGLSDRMHLFNTINSLDGGASVAREIISSHYHPGQKLALVFSEDTTAIGCLQEFLRNGVHVPEDVALIGYDNSNLCTYSTPNISSVDSRPDIIGKEAARILYGMSHNTAPAFKNIVVSPVLVHRETT